MLGEVRRRFVGYDDEIVDEPMDTDDQERLILKFELDHTRTNRLFRNIFRAICGIVVMVFGLLACRGEMFHFDWATEEVSIACSLSTCVLAVLAAVRIGCPDTHGYDSTWRTTQFARRRWMIPAAAAAALPSCYHGYLAFGEVTSTAMRTGDLLDAFSPHHFLFLWPITLLCLTEYVAFVMQNGYHDINELRSVKYTFKAV